MSRRSSLRNRRSSSMESKKEEIPGSATRREKLIFSRCAPSSCCLSIPAADPPFEEENDIGGHRVDTKVEVKCWKRYLKPILFTSVLFIIGTILGVFLRPKSDMVCFIRLGCFSISGPWAERPSLFNFVPQSPSVINTTFIITSRQDPRGQHGVVPFPHNANFRVINEANVPWNTSSLIVFLIHGYTDRSGTWMQRLRRAFLAQKEDIIVILVDWQAGASGFYPQVVANTRVVAKEIVLFIRGIQRRFGRDIRKRIHLVGHSLGSHISAYVGKAFVNSSFPIHQITALDPAFPLFEGYCAEIRLHRSDALNVLAIHSNMGPIGLGMKNRVGTVDIYLNDGRDQRGCPKLGGIWKDNKMEQEETIDMKVDNKSLPKILEIFSDIKDGLVCSHRRAYDWLEDVLMDLAGVLWAHSKHNLATATVIAYPISWMNSTDIVSLAKNRAVHFSLCREQGDKGCWKLERNENEGFFTLPSQQSNESMFSPSTFLIPTTHESPLFCVRYALLEMSVCPVSSSHFAPLLRGKWDNWETEENTTLTLSQVAFNEEIKIYEGLFQGSNLIQAWVEFPCDALQEAVHQDESHYDDDFLSVKLHVSFEEDSSRIKDEQRKGSFNKSKGRNNEEETRSGPSLCVNRMKLIYFNETQKDIVRLHWRTDDESALNQKLLISSKECVEVRFPL